MTDWREVELGSVVELKRGYDLPVARREPGAIPVVSSSGRSGFHSTAKVAGPGVVTGRYGTLGDVYFIPEDFWPLNTALYVRDFKGNNQRFIAALLTSLKLCRNDSAAAVPGVNRNHLHRLRVRIPSRVAQDRIGTLLLALDDLIEIAERRIQLLEQMAQAIYREWFVRFRYPGYEDGATLDLTAGAVPSGWGWESLDAVCTAVATSVDPGAIDAATPAVGLEHLGRKTFTLTSWGTAGDLESRKLRFRRGDILFGKIRPYFHKVSLAPMDGICSTDAIVLRPQGARTAFVLLTVFSDEFVAHAVTTSNGTKMPRADWRVLRSWRVPKPPAEVARLFEAALEPILQSATVLMEQARVLGTVRELLLPRLISGDIDTSALNLDVLVEEATG